MFRLGLSTTAARRTTTLLSTRLLPAARLISTQSAHAVPRVWAPTTVAVATLTAGTAWYMQSLPVLLDSPPNVAALTTQADNLYNANKIEELYTLLSGAVTSQPNEAEIRWRLARACKEVGACTPLMAVVHTEQKADASKNPDEKKALTYAAYEHAKKALELNPNHFAVQKWMAITISKIGDYEGTKVQISNAFLIKDHFEKARALNPKDATTHHLIGLWCFTFAEMPWYMSRVASMLYATPPSSTFDEALQNFMRAEETEPGFYKRNQLMIAKTLAKLGRNDESKKWLEKAIALPTKNLDDETAHAEAVALKK